MSGRWDSPELDPEALERLWASGYGALAEGRFQDAMDAAQALEDLGSTTAFELRGHVQLAAGDPRRAVAALRLGVGKGPGNWVLLQLLGAAYSEAGQPELAEETFVKAAAVEGADLVSIDLNRATLAARQGDRDRARALLDAHEPGPFAQRYAHLRAELALEEGDSAGALAACKAALDGATPEQDDVRGALLAAAATALLEMNRRVEARAAAEAAIEIERGQPEALAVVRALDAGDPAGCRWWYVTVRGLWPERPGAARQAFMTAYVGVATGPEELARMGARLEPEPLAATIELVDGRPAEGEDGAQPGVHGMGDHLFDRISGTRFE